MKICSVEGCGRKHEAKGLCSKHYQSRRYTQIPEVRERILAHGKAYHQRPEVKEHRKEYCQRPDVSVKIKAKYKEYSKDYWHRPYVKERKRAWDKLYFNNPENILKRRKIQKGSETRKKEKALNHYGHKCACCGENKTEFLTFDHANNDGYQHRKIIGSSTRIYNWLIKNNFPEEPKIQLLCWNCQEAKADYGYCPHKTLYTSSIPNDETKLRR